MVYCNNCGNQLYSDRYCKKCGYKSPEIKNKIKCPECGNLIGDSDYCGKCGFKLTKNLNYVIRESNIKKCPKCSNKNNLDAEFCGNCGETLPLVSNMELIKCPECNHLVRDDTNFCRFCGHDFITNKNSLFKKKYNRNIGYCQNCGKKNIDLSKTPFCTDCGTKIPSNNNFYSSTSLDHETYYSTLTNGLIVPLSKHYNVNFRKTTLSDYFNISSFQESHLIYLIMNDLIIDYEINAIKRFKKYLDETINIDNPKKEILSHIESMLTDTFNNKGIEIFDIATIKRNYYKTVETPVIQNKHRGLTRGIATLGFGIVGLAATSGVKQTTATKQVLQKGKYTHRKITIKDEHIVLKTYEDSSQDLNFNSNWNNITKFVFNWEDINSLDDEHYFIFNNGKTLKCPIPDTTEWIAEGVMRVLGTTNLDENYITNQEWIGKLEPDVKEIFFDLIRNKIKKSKVKSNNNTKVIESDSTNINELEKIVKMHQDGLLTDDEFIAMKQNIIGSIHDSNDNSIENNSKFCGNCGAEIIGSSKFCTQCGNQLN